MTSVCIINAVGLTPELLKYAPRISAIGESQPMRSPLPAVTCTSQATLLTGLSPAQHGIVGNGWYYRDTQEIRFWQQANSLISGQKFYEGIETAKMFWWFNQSAPVKYSATPKPHYGCDGSKVFDILDHTQCDLVRRLGPFPFFSFWGPNAGLPSSEWIADATAIVMRENRPKLTMAYLPHLDYDFQRLPDHAPERVAELDHCAGRMIDAANDIDAQVIVVSEYGLVPVQRPVHLNRYLREMGWLTVRPGPFGELMMPGESDAFAVADHQLAHVYVRNTEMIDEVAKSLLSVPGVARVARPVEFELDHPRSGELIVLSEPDAWFTYYYWLDDSLAPDFSRTVDIHRKPGYDPCELFMTSKVRAMSRLAQKKIGMRYKMDVIPLDAQLVRGSHGLHTLPEKGPLVVGPGELPDDMRNFKAYVQRLLA
ncbi:MAG: alkaline phosphatase family protein [Rhodopirellula sp.]|nr:alkaline phosphatase family protein [Rhodopirellula sp.]MAI73313.1 alkaline phosphatase family protein [Rhodopirellula sp.]OUX50385.1 MAG: alkaline phosphatase family protein [Rhodopirellula sp. TMED283]